MRTSVRVDIPFTVFVLLAMLAANVLAPFRTAKHGRVVVLTGSKNTDPSCPEQFTPRNVPSIGFRVVVGLPTDGFDFVSIEPRAAFVSLDFPAGIFLSPHEHPPRSATPQACILRC